MPEYDFVPVDHDPFTYEFHAVDHDPFACDRAKVRQLFIVRHGATKMNGESGVSVDRERGWSDVRLTEEGREDARKAGEEFKGKGIDLIVSSDLERAKETAEIIGDILGIAPEFSFKLRPWNLGNLTGVDMTKAKPQIADYACDKPDEKVPGGESFEAFKERAFEGLAEILERHPDDKILIVCHLRVVCLLDSWDADGQLPDHTIDIKVFLADGDPPGGIKVLGTTETGLRGEKFSHDAVDFGESKAGNKCRGCRSFKGRNDCKKVMSPIGPDDWCKVGVGRKSGKPFAHTGIGSHDMDDTMFHPSLIGASEAPDGEHYLPDPERRGKYLKVEW